MIPGFLPNPLPEGFSVRHEDLVFHEPTGNYIQFRGSSSSGWGIMNTHTSTVFGNQLVLVDFTGISFDIHSDSTVSFSMSDGSRPRTVQDVAIFHLLGFRTNFRSLEDELSAHELAIAISEFDK